MKVNRVLSCTLMLLVVSCFTASVEAKIFSTSQVNILKKELGAKPDILLFVNFKKSRGNNYYNTVAPGFYAMFQKESSSKCFRNIPHANFDYGLVVGKLKSSTSKESVLAVAQGSFNSSTLASCLASENKMTYTTFKGVSAYRNKSGNEIILVTGPDTIILGKGSFIKKINPRKSTLATGSLASFSPSNHNAAMEGWKFEKGSDVSKALGYIDLGMNITVKATVTFRDIKNLRKTKRQIDQTRKSALFAQFLTGLTYTTSSNTLKVGYVMNSKQFNVVWSLLSAKMNLPAKKPHVTGPRIIP
ncbi:MAG: hypothetical protein JXR95_13180 [Deltaproteobacteria bacterium]|nr:hypothetical protein [Deltaproteobacteria bacterium]